MCFSCSPENRSPMVSIFPSRIDTSPSMTSKASFMVTIVPTRMRTLSAGKLRRRPLHGCGVFLAMLDGDELGEDADRDFLRRHGADVEADGRVDALQAIGGHAALDERVVDARHLG